MMKIWDIATSNQGGRGLARFVGTMNRMYSLYIGSLCSLPNGTLYLLRDFTRVRGNLNAMKQSIERCLLYGQKTFMNSVQH